MKPLSRGLSLADVATAFLAMGCFGAMVYFAFVAFTGEQASHPLLPAEPDALPERAPAAVAPLHAPTAEQRQADQAIAALVDKLEAVIARGPSESRPEENAAALLDRMTTLQASASLDGLYSVISMRKRFAARAQAAAAAGRNDEARRLEAFSRFQPAPAPTAPDGQAGESPRGAAIPQGEFAAAVEKNRPGLPPNPAPPIVPNSAPDERVDGAPPEQIAVAPVAPGAGNELTAAAAASLPVLAPVRVVLAIARGDADRAKRATDIKQALAAAGVEVADFAAVPAPPATPGIGYYFRSDRDAAVGISRQLESLLGGVDPVLRRVHGSIPQPGTIEITIP